MNINLNNYNKPSHPLFKKIGDICLFAIPLYITTLTTLPIPDKNKVLMLTVLSILLATIKIVTKFTLDPNYVDTTTQVDKDNS